MKTIILLLLLLNGLSPFSQSGREQFVIEGTFKNAPADIDWIYLNSTIDGEIKFDSTKVQNGKFRFLGTVAEPTYCGLRVTYRKTEDGTRKLLNVKRDIAIVFLEKGTIYFTASDSLTNAIVSGSAVHDQYVKLAQKRLSYESRLATLKVEYLDFLKNNDTLSSKKTQAIITAVVQEMRDSVYKKYIEDNPSSPLSMYALKQYINPNHPNPEQIERLLNLLSKENQNWPSAKQLRVKIEAQKRKWIGNLAPRFTLTDTSGAIVSFSNFKGKWVLLHFWASWCGPCRVENPHLIEVYRSYKDKGFEIIGVSIDRPIHKDRWLNAIRQDKIEWPQICDLKNTENEVALLYGVDVIPQNFLIDPQGKVVSKDFSLEELEVRLKKIFNSNLSTRKNLTY